MRSLRVHKHDEKGTVVAPPRFFDSDRMFDEFLEMGRGWDGGWGMGSWSFAVDMEETKDAITLKAELPGLQKEDVKITCEDNILTISGEKHMEKESHEKKMHRVERAYGSFHRSFTLPPGAKAEEVTATYKDGVMTVRVPKHTGTKAREVHIKVE